MIGYAICGSFCTHQQSIKALKMLKGIYGEVMPIISEKAASTDTRFGTCENLIKTVTGICGRKPVMTIADAEPIGPKIKLDVLIIAPCTGNTLAKIALGITDTTVTMAAKAHMRNSRPVLIALASNDGLSGNLSNIGTLMCRKNVYFVPMLQDDPIRKPHSLVADFGLLEEAAQAAVNGIQMRPVFRTV